MILNITNQSKKFHFAIIWKLLSQFCSNLNYAAADKNGEEICVSHNCDIKVRRQGLSSRTCFNGFILKFFWNGLTDFVKIRTIAAEQNSRKIWVYQDFKLSGHNTSFNISLKNFNITLSWLGLKNIKVIIISIWFPANVFITHS